MFAKKFTTIYLDTLKLSYVRVTLYDRYTGKALCNDAFDIKEVADGEYSKTPTDFTMVQGQS